MGKQGFPVSEAAAIDAAMAMRDAVYRERDALVAALSKVFPAHLARHQGDWEDDWRNIVCIHLPTGQATWHIHDSELIMFGHLRMERDHWDGHSTKEKYRRVNALSAVGTVAAARVHAGEDWAAVPPPPVFPAQTAPPAESQERTQP